MGVLIAIEMYLSSFPKYIATKYIIFHKMRYKQQHVIIKKPTHFLYRLTFFSQTVFFHGSNNEKDFCVIYISPKNAHVHNHDNECSCRCTILQKDWLYNHQGAPMHSDAATLSQKLGKAYCVRWEGMT